MKIEFELPDSYANDKIVVCMKEYPTPIAYCNIYEPGDVWVKIHGCEDCSYENRVQCCGTCPMNTEKGCFFHIDTRSNVNKPFHCVVSPDPGDCISYCLQEFKCTKGSNVGKIRKISQPGDVFA